MPTSFGLPPKTVPARIRRLKRRLGRVISNRAARPWTAMIAVPLAMIVCWLSEEWFTLPLLCMTSWWWADRRWPWTWLVAVEAGAFGSVWAYAGASALAQFADARPFVFIVWIGVALTLASVSLLNRRRNGHFEDYPGY